MLSTLVFGALRGQERHQKRQEFIVQAQQLAFAIETQFGVPLELLRAVAALFLSSNDVSREEFRTFVRPIIERHPSIYAFEWMPLVRDAQRDSLVTAVQAEGFREFHLQQKDAAGKLMVADRRADYLPILYMEPLEPAILGLDVIGNPERGDESFRARASGSSTASDRYSLVEDPDDVFSVISYEPVSKPSPGSERQFIGLVGVLLRLDPVLREALSGGGAEGIHVLLRDESAPEEKRVLFSSHPDAEGHVSDGAWTQVFDFADRRWSVRLTPLPDSSWMLGHGPVALWVAGLLLGVLAAFGSGALLQIGRLRKRVDEAVELGQYRLGHRLGEGGMGVVYRAEHRMLARPAAIKLIQPGSLGDEGPARQRLLERFEREAKATASLRSPHTIQVYDFGRTDDGQFYYVMELLDGLDLETLVERAGPVPAARVVYILRQVCQSLAEAHAVGLVHRDIKPANIYLCRHGLEHDVVKVLDFGLVLEGRRGSGDATAATRTQAFVGTPAFCAPEMADSSGGDVDGRADIYSLGCVAYRLLTGRDVFEGNTAVAVMIAHMAETPVPPSERTERAVPSDLERVVLRCLEKDRSKRPRSARELERLLRECACSGEWTETRAAAWWSETQVVTSDGDRAFTS